MSTVDATGTTGERRAWGWVAHLRAGGTTDWRDWADLSESQGRYLPGAQQLELLRRLNAAGRPSPALAEAVLAASAAGRGRPDLELVGASEESPFGPRPVDPADLPAGELIRVAASVLADQVLATGTPPATETPRPSRWRRGYRLVGDPELANPWRAELTAQGRPPGGREPRILVVATDLASMLAHAWITRAFTERAASWPQWLDLHRARHTLPPHVDLVPVCRAWEKRTSKERVHVVLDPGAVRRLAHARARLTQPVTLDGEAAELARRVGSVLGLLVLPEDRSALLSSRLRPRLEAQLAHTPGAGPPVVPAAHREWVEQAARRMRTGLAGAGYAVHGDLDALIPTWPADDTSRTSHTSGPSAEVTLDLAVRVLLEGRTA